jgi:hypothetical protein
MLPSALVGLPCVDKLGRRKVQSLAIILLTPQNNDKWQYNKKNNTPTANGGS